MSDDFSVLNLSDDYEEVLRAPDASRWKLEKPGPLEVLATMFPLSAPKELFQARLLWRVYPDEAPSLKFRDPQTRRLDMPSAWPRVRGFRPPSLDACVNYSLEGFNLHPEWRNDARLRWDRSGNVLLRELRTLQSELDNYYQGRHP